jgi:hypothetical protein
MGGKLTAFLSNTHGSCPFIGKKEQELLFI